MKIIILTEYIGHEYSIPPFIYQQSQALQSLGHEINIIASKTLFKKYPNDNIGRTLNVPINYAFHLSASVYGKYNFNIWMFYLRIKKMCKKFNPDIILAHTITFEGYVAVMLKQKYGIPVVITGHGSDITVEIKNGKSDFLKKICTKADAIVTVSRKLKNELLAIDPFFPVTVIHNGCKQPQISVDKIPYSILSVGNLINSKQFDLTIRAVSALRNRFSNITLTIIGSGPEKESLQKLVNDLNVQDIVFFKGQLTNDEVLEYMAKSTVFCLPSYPEGLGVVYLEAISQGCITIGSEGEGISDIITTGENGLLVKSGDLNGLTQALHRALYDVDFAQSMLIKAAETAKNLSWERNAEKNIENFKRLIGFSND